MKKTNNPILLGEGERVDDLLIHEMKIIQHEQQFRFSTDAILLAYFATLKMKAKAADLGTGTGVIAMLLAARGASYVEGFEINPYMAELAKRSVILNGLEDIITVENLDLRQIKVTKTSGTFDLVVSNPPYRPIEKGKINPNDDIAIARHEILATLQDVVEAARYLLKYRGRFAMVHLPERLAEIISTMQRFDIEPKRIQMVQGTAEKKPTMVLIEGIVGAKPGLSVDKPFIIYKQDGTYCDELLKYYQR